MIRRRALLRPPSRRSALLASSALLALAAAASALVTPTSAPTYAAAPALADLLGPQTWAFAIPLSWIAAPIDGLREGDVLDLIATRTSERATASEIAQGLRVMAMDERALVVELTSDDAAAIAEARARGLSFVPILRSTR